MSVYVDSMRAQFGRMTMCHMVADTDAELHAMADRIGVARKWFQGPPRHENSHYDIALSKRAIAVAAGAIEITWKECAAMCYRRRETGQLGSPADAVAWMLADKAANRSPEAQVARDNLAAALQQRTGRDE